MGKLRYGLVGTGSRARMYIDAMLGDHSEVAELLAIADVNPGRMRLHTAHIEASGGTAPAAYSPDDLEAMIAEHRLDRVIITSPDVTHAPMIVRALDAGTDVVVEKPLTIDAEGCRAILAAVERTGRSVTVTFNYRYSPRNSALKELIASGAIGRVTSVHFEWVLDTNHGADYFRRWHRDKANSGGLLIHKASHHFDLVNWWIDDAPVRVFASGGLRFYGDANARIRGLGERPERGSIDGNENDPFSLDLRTNPALAALYLENEEFDGYRRDQDVFSGGITIEDNLSLVVDYRNGASMSYSLNAHAPWEGYVVAVNGTEGRAELTVVERGSVLDDDSIDPSVASRGADAEVVRPQGERLVLQRHWEHAREVPIANDEGDHGGGDVRLLTDVFRGAGDDPLARPAGYVDGLRSVVVGIAGNASLESGAAVLIDGLGLGVSLARSEPQPPFGRQP
ncbi:Gfo/Idh/MocA family protein [Planctomonas psychrotolerans]|uniref:Gfo/Idh/MocA family protein n=1 Tax=Planctomonas psychrotolerans TaxID=2528712 RepID=UPI00123A8354|nr:Gfo/Idh/MocA family oxidoreductase [Planctomonas psychrotolerans]